jgi:hypothetical protein
MRLRHGVPSAEDRRRREQREFRSNKTMTARTIGHRLYTDGVNRPVYEDGRGQYIVDDGERVDGVWLVPEKGGADTPVIVEGR